MESNPVYNDDPRSKQAVNLYNEKKYRDAYDLYKEMINEGVRISSWDKSYMAWCIYHVAIKKDTEDMERLFRSAKYISTLIEQEHDSKIDCYSFSILRACETLSESNYEKEKIASLYQLINKDLLKTEPAPGTNKDGKTFKYPSDLEKYCFGYSKVLLGLNRFDDCIALCDYALSHIREYANPDNCIWFEYRIAKCFLKMGQKEKAKTKLLDIVKEKHDQFWAWKDLGDTYESVEDKLACYCRGLLCKSEEDYLTGLREEIIPYFLEVGERDAAKYELDNVFKLRSENGWKISKELFDLQSMDWARSGTNISNITPIYEKYAISVEELLFGGVPESDIFIIWKNEDMNLAGYYLEDTIPHDKNADGVLKGEYSKNISLYGTYSIKLKKDRGGRYIPISKPTSTNNLSLRNKYIKSIEGEVRMHGENRFGFVDDVFIPPDVVEKYGLKNSEYFTGVAVKLWNEKNGEMSWRAFINDKTESNCADE